jgi:hypothetical protein
VDLKEIKRLAQTCIAHADAVESDKQALQRAITTYCAQVRGGTLTLAEELNVTVQHISDICHNRRRVSTVFAKKIVRLNTP